jgi:hypothetical protein
MNIIFVLSGLIPGLLYKEILKTGSKVRYFLFESIRWPERQNLLVAVEISIFIIEIIFQIILFLLPSLIFLLIFFNYLKFENNPQYYFILPAGYVVFLIVGIIIRRKIF